MATWFDKLSPAAQKAYIKSHPNSKYAKGKKASKKEPVGVYGGLRARGSKQRVSKSNSVTRARSVDGKIKAAQDKIDDITKTLKYGKESNAKLKLRLSQLTNWAAKARLRDRIKNAEESDKRSRALLKKYKETLKSLKAKK